MSDTLQRFLFEHLPIRGELVQLDASWQAVLERHDYPAAVRTPLGEMMAAGVLLAATLKFDGAVILQVQGHGPITLMVVEVTAGRTVRGLAHWTGEVPEGDLHARFGDGRLVITIDQGAGKERYQGIVELRGLSLAAALDDYLARSEQLTTRLWLAADGDNAAGLLLQRLPGESVDEDAWQRMVTLGDTITTGELLRLSARDVIRRLFHEEDVRLFAAEPVRFHCSCSRERVAAALRGLGQAEMTEILAQEGAVEVLCEFCNRRYAFDAVDAAQLFAEMPQPEVRPTRH